MEPNAVSIDHVLKLWRLEKKSYNKYELSALQHNKVNSLKLIMVFLRRGQGPKAVRSCWRSKILWLILGILKNNPFMLRGLVETIKSCAVGCEIGYYPEKKADATFGSGKTDREPTILRSMESTKYYPENNISYARRWEGI